MLHDLLGGNDAISAGEAAACTEIAELFDNSPADVPKTFLALHGFLRGLQRELDTAINNCGVNRTLTAAIHTTQGNLVFGIPTAVSRHVPEVHGLRFLYLLDEFENLSFYQQKYINTLIRERKEPVSIKIGARLYGIRTPSTYCADEDNKEGSEHETLRLDAWLRKVEPQYASFVRRLVVRRLMDYKNVAWPAASSSQEMKHMLGSYFEKPPYTRFGQKETAFVLAKYAGRDRPYFLTLRRNLETGIKAGVAPGVTVSTDADSIIDLLRVADYPLLEKVNILLLYKAWNSSRNLGDSATKIANNCQRFVKDPKSSPKYARVMHHFRADLLAQLRRECGGGRRQRQSYLGLDTLIAMSWGIPRHLLILLKEAYGWATFNGEQPFSEGALSVRAQEAGVMAAAKWFFGDAAMAGADGKQVQDSIARLATLFREIRFSHKPSECSAVTFSYDETKASAEARRIIECATNWSLLIEVGKQRDRNSLRVDTKLQLNRMLAPLWDLPIYRRGVLALSPDEVNAIFDDKHVATFDQLKQDRVARMTAPFFGRKAEQQSPPTTRQDRLLPGFDDE